MEHGEPVYFAAPSALRKWFARHARSAEVLWLGFHKVGSGKPSVTWPQAVDEALCVGWIDGVRKSLGPEAYVIRFTPRKARSTWSAVNIRRARELEKEGRMTPAGLAAFRARRDDRSAIYSYEQRKAAALAPGDVRRLRAEPAAWAWFQAQARSYQRAAAHWLASAKKPETRERRLTQLVACSAQGRPVPPFVPRRGKA